MTLMAGGLPLGPLEESAVLGVKTPTLCFETNVGFKFAVKRVKSFVDRLRLNLYQM